MRIFIFAIILFLNSFSIFGQNNLNDTIRKDMKITVEIWSDVMCPFCYIGKKKFEKALSQFPDSQLVEIKWKSFQLDPNIKRGEGGSYTNNLAEKKGLSIEQVKGLFQNVTDAGKEVGLELNFEKAIVANSFDAHRLTQLADKYGKKSEVKEALFKAHFTDGLDISSFEVLLKIAEDAGIPNLKMRDMLDNNLHGDEVLNQIQEAENLGIRSVPFFVFNRKFSISGAQDPEVFLNALKKSKE